MRRLTAAGPAAFALACVLAAGGCATSPAAAPDGYTGVRIGAHPVAPEPRGPRLTVTGAYLPQPALPDMAAGYFTVTNSGDSDAELTSVTSDLSDDITLHSTQGNRMRQVTSFTVPAGGALTLRTGGNHLMLADLTRTPVAGDTVAMRLHFAGAAPLDVSVPVEPLAYRPKAG